MLFLFTMWRAQQLRNVWNWLPAFRAVAESEHLPSASDALHVSPSALSRTIRLLEQEVGRPLFDRAGRTIRLNDAGQALLAVVRDSMRLVDEGLSRVSERAHLGAISIAAPGPFVPIFVQPALEVARARYPGLTPQLVMIGNINDRLLRGDIDLALVESMRAEPEIESEVIATLEHYVYCGATHPLAKRKRLTMEDLCDEPFVAPMALSDGTIPDEWPEHMPRVFGMRVTQMQIAVDACLGSPLLGVFADAIGDNAGLHRLPLAACATTHLYMLRRKPLLLESSADLLAAEIRAVAAELER